MDYYDIDDILCEDQKIKCIFNSTIPGLSWLEGGHDEALKENTRIDLPFWLSQELAQGPVDRDQNSPIQMEVPEFFKSKVLNGLRADATMVDIPKLCPSYFRFGVQYLDVSVDVPLATALVAAFKTRLALIMDHTQSGSSRDQAEYLARLDETERDLFKAGLESSALTRQWNSQSFGRIRSSNELLLKRKNMD